MKRQREQVREEPLAVLAASRELTVDHDEALADLILDRVAHPGRLIGADRARRRGARHAGSVPMLVTFAIATFMSLVAALASGASVVDFLEVRFSVICVVAAVMQVGLYFGARVSERPRRV